MTSQLLFQAYSCEVSPLWAQVAVALYDEVTRHHRLSVEGTLQCKFFILQSTCMN